MGGYGDWGLDATIASRLEESGWQADDDAVRALVPAVLRGGNAVLVAPPGPAWAGPALGALLGRPEATTGAVLLLTAPSLADEWIGTLAAFCAARGVRIAAADSAAAGSQLAGAGVIVASPAAAIARHRQSALGVERIRAVVLAWPEDWPADQDVAPILADVPLAAQRLIITSMPDALSAPDGLATRYARKAIVVRWPAVAPGRAGSRPPGVVLTVPSTWGDRAAVAARVARGESRRVVVWTADSRDNGLLERALAACGASMARRAVPDSAPVLCYDPPSPDDLRAMRAAGDVIMLVPPGTERYVRRIAADARPLPIDAAVAAQLDRDADARRGIEQAIEAGDDAAALYALAPLFERYDPQRVASAVFTLWRGADQKAPATVSAPVTCRVRIAAGKRDGATPGDFVAVLVKEVGVDRTRIGRIELHDTYSLVELPSEDAERVAQRLSGLTIRRRRLSARLEQGGRR